MYRSLGTILGMRRLTCLAILFATSVLSHAQLGNPEKQAIANALYLSNLESADLIRPRATNGPLWIRNAINDPFLGIEQLGLMQSNASSRSLPQLLNYLRTKVYDDAESMDVGPAGAVEVPDTIPETLRPSVKRLAEAILRSNEAIRQGLQKLSAAERRTLIEALPRQAIGAAPIKFDFVRQPMPDDEVVSELVGKVELKWIRFAGQMLAQEVQEELPKLKEAAKTAALTGKLKATINGVVVEIGGTTDDLHDDTDAVLCIDLGGNDRYTGRYGAGVGYSSVLIDLAGDDMYECPDLSIGAAVLGVGLAFDLGGDDRLKGKSICFGVGIAGVGAWLKDGGDDDYRSVGLAQGFGFHGLGVLIDVRGEDHYRLGILGQGAARAGGTGLLIDKSGRDTYRSGGIAPHPYVLETTISMAQGAADGAGAFGCLVDLSGIDVYLADSRAQGFGASGGVGVLLDPIGRDTYSATNEAQSFATSSGASYLLDADGDDTYSLRIGNGHANATNYGLAVLVDQQGNDLYFGADSRPGSAMSNATALFVEVKGDDRYAGPPGVGSPARGSGSVGVFVDLTGSDQYADGLRNGQAKVESPWGSALDEVGFPAKVEMPDPPKPGSKPLLDDAGMEALYQKATADDRSALDDLTAIGEPALRWMITKKLARANEVQIALIAWIAIQVGTPAEDICIAAIDLTKENVAKNAILVCQSADIKRAAPRIVEAIAVPGLARTAIRAAGALDVAEAAPGLIAIAGGADLVLKRMAIISLGQLGDERSFALMQAQLESNEPEMRFAAVSLLAKFSQRAIPFAKQLLSSTNEKSARSAVELLAKIGNADAIAEILPALSDPRRGVQIQALLALDGRAPRSSWPAIVELRKSNDALVKSVANRVDLGR